MTGAFKEYRTKTPDSGPHGLAADKEHLVCGELPRVYRQARSQDGDDHRMLARAIEPKGVATLYTIIMGIRGAAEEYPADRHLLQSSILFAGGAEGYNNSNGSAMSLNKKRPLAALYFANRIIQRDFPLRAYVAPNVGDPFMGAHSFSSVNALYLHGVRHPNLLTGACYQDCHAFVRYAIALSKDASLRCPARLRGAK